MFYRLKKFYIDRCVNSPAMRKRKGKQFVNLKDAKGVVLLYDADSLRNEKVMELIQKMGIQGNVQAWGYTNRNDNPSRDMVNVHILRPKNISFLGKPERPLEESFLLDDYDILIDLTMTELLPMKYLLGVSRTSCRCGYSKEGYDGLYDLEVSKISGKKEEDLLTQILFYLTTIQTKL